MSVLSVAGALEQLKIIQARVVAWLRVLSNACALMLSSSLRLEDVFGGDDLPVSFILERDSRREKSRNGKRRYAMPATVVKGIGRPSSVHLAAHRAHARSTLRARADRSDDRQAA